MRFDFPFIDVLVIPTGATTGVRIEIDGVNGTITGYDASNNVVFQLNGTDAIWGNIPSGTRVEIDGDTGTVNIYDSSNNLVVMISEDGISAINPFSGAISTLGTGPAIVGAPSSDTSSELIPGTTHNTPSLTPHSTNDLELRYVGVFALPDLSTSFTSPATYTERTDASNTTNTVHSTLATKELASGAATGIQTFTSSANFNRADDVSQGITIDIESASGVNATYRSSSTSLTDTITKPAGTAQNDILVAFASFINLGDLTPPTGWSVLTDLTVSFDTRTTVWYRIAGASEPASYTFGGVATTDGIATMAAIQNANVTGLNTAGLTLDDANLYRSAANTLKTDDSLIIAADLDLGDDMTLSSGSTLTWANDTTISRLGAGVLGVNDDLQVAGQSVARGLVDTVFDATTSNGPHSADAATDMTITNVSVVAGRWYKISFHSQLELVGTGVWTVDLRLNGSTIDRLCRIDQNTPVITADATVWWQAPTSQATDDFDVFANEASGTATLELVGAASVHRWLTIEDAGI